MQTQPRQEERAPEPADRSPAWTAFLVVAGIVAAWFALGAYVVALGSVFDPLFLLALGVACAIAVSSERGRPGRRAMFRRWTCRLAFAAGLAFVLFRPFVGFGDTSDIRLLVTVLDHETGGPVEGAYVTADLTAVSPFWGRSLGPTEGVLVIADGRVKLPIVFTDERGAAMLKFEQWTWTYHSWLLSWRYFEPKTVTVHAGAKSYLNSSRAIDNRAEYRVHLINDDFRRPRKEVTLWTEIKLRKGEAADRGVDGAACVEARPGQPDVAQQVVKDEVANEDDAKQVQLELRGATAMTILYPVAPLKGRLPTAGKTVEVSDPTELKGALNGLKVLGAWKGAQAGHVPVLRVDLVLADGSTAILDFLYPGQADRSHWGELYLDRTFYDKVCAIASQAEGTKIDPVPDQREPSGGEDRR